MEEVILLADPKSPAWCFAEKIHDYIQSKYETDYPLNEVKIEKFRVGEFLPHVPNNVRQRHTYFISDSSQDPSRWWAELLLMKDLLLDASAKKVNFVLPCYLWARQDRKDKPHVPISARAVANSISKGLSRMITMDLHANQIHGFFPPEAPVDNLYSFPWVVRYIQKNHPEILENIAVSSVDVGGAKKARSFASKLEKINLGKEYPMVLIDKNRPRPGEVTGSIVVGNVKGKDVIIVDDMIDSGNSLISAADALKKKGAKNLYCYATHGFFTAGDKKLTSKYDKIFVTNTIPMCEKRFNNKKIEIIDMSGAFAEAIYRAQTGMSISKLFEV